MPKPTSPAKIAAALTELWSPRVVAEVDDAYVKVAKLTGTFGWHAHADEDELFLVLKGHLRIEMEAGATACLGSIRSFRGRDSIIFNNEAAPQPF